jgi:restriction system protein
MADVTRRRTGELLRKLFEILMASPDGMKAKDALAKLAAAVTMSEYEASEYPNGGGRRFEKNVRFSTVDATHATRPLAPQRQTVSTRMKKRTQFEIALDAAQAAIEEGTASGKGQHLRRDRSATPG